MKRSVLCVGIATLVATSIGVACSSSSDDSSINNNDGGGGDAQLFDSTTPPGDGSSITDAGSDGSGFIVTGTVTLNGTANGLSYNPTTNELWVSSQGHNDAGISIGAVTLIDNATFTAKATVTGEGFTAIVVAPDVNKAFVANTTSADAGGFIGEIDVIDGVTHALTPVAPFAHAFDTATSLTYDPGSHRVYASVSAGYVLVIDATTSTLVTTIPYSAVSPAGFLSFGEIAVDPTGSQLFMMSGDINSYPKVGTFTIDGGAISSIAGGQDAGWEIGIGPPAVLPQDAGGGAAVAIKLRGVDAGAFIHIFDPADPQLNPGDTPIAIAILKGTVYVGGSFFNSAGEIAIALVDACGKFQIRLYDPSTGAVTNQIFFGDSDTSMLDDYKDSIGSFTQIDPTPPTNGKIHIAVATSLPEGDSVDPPPNTVVQVTLDTSVSKPAPCP